MQQVTPALRQWIIAQAQAGHPPEAVLESMRVSGWREDVAGEKWVATKWLRERRFEWPCRPVNRCPGVPVVDCERLAQSSIE